MMQYPPEQPAHQPYYPPAEIYQPEQRQEYAPQETAQPPLLAQEITVYAKGKQLIWRTVVCVFCLFIIVLIIPLIAILGILTGQPVELGDIIPSLILVVLSAVFIGWISWTMLSMVLSKKPLLRINHEGITVSPMSMLSGFSISWEEVGAIFPSRYMYKYLCISPKNPDYFLETHFNAFERFNRRINAMIGAPLYVPRIYMDKPIEEILQQVYYTYASELSYYRVQIRV